MPHNHKQLVAALNRRQQSGGNAAVSIVVDWIPSPMELALANTLELMKLAQSSPHGGAYDLVLVLVPIVWDLMQLNFKDANRVVVARRKLLDPSQWTVSKAYWEAWRSFPASAATRFAAVTQPIQRIKCDIYGTNITRPRFGWQLWSNETYATLGPRAARLCGDCCVRAAVAKRNRLLERPSDWWFVDWNALVDQQSRPIDLTFNWHFMCQLAARPVRGDPSALSVRAWRGGGGYSEKLLFFEKTTAVQVTTRWNGECSDAGNTLLWDHLARADDAFLERPADRASDQHSRTSGGMTDSVRDVVIGRSV